MTDLPTPRRYAGEPFRVTAQCRRCQHETVLDLVALAAGPHADTPIVELPLRCRCGARDFGVTVAILREPFAG